MPDYCVIFLALVYCICSLLITGQGKCPILFNWIRHIYEFISCQWLYCETSYIVVKTKLVMTFNLLLTLLSLVTGIQYSIFVICYHVILVQYDINVSVSNLSIMSCFWNKILLCVYFGKNSLNDVHICFFF